ncbi:MAG: DUF2079 domain-containing protein [Trebonia sp.]
MLGERPAGEAAVDEADDHAVIRSAGTARFSRPLPVLGPLLTPVLQPLLRRWPAAAPGSPWRDPVIWAIAALSFGAYFAVSLFKLLQLAPSSYDLGIYTEFVKQLSQLHAPIDDVLGAGFNLEGNHFQIAVGVIAPFFRLFPTPATLLFFQALFAAVSVFAVATAAFSLTTRGTGRLIAFAYAFSWGLQQMIDFDFHEIALAVPLIAFSVCALVRRRPAAAIGWAMPLVFVEESQGFTVAAIGGLLMATAVFPSLLRSRPAPSAGPARPARPQDYDRVALWGGLFLMAWGLFWSTFAITVIIPHFNPTHQYYFWKDGGAVGGGHPFSVSALLVQAGGGWPTKAETLVLLLLPTVFVALGSPVALLALPSVALRFISPNTAYWGTAFHYNATVMPILCIAAIEAIGRWRRSQALAWPSGAPPASAAFSLAGRARDLVHSAQAGAVRHGGAMMAAVAVALAFQFPLSNLWQGSTYQLGAHVAAADAAMAVVPDGATVQTTLDLLAPLAARTDTFWIGNKGNPLTQYVVFDGPDSGYSPAITNVPQFIAQLYPGDGYVTVFDRDGVYVFRRG